jgi:hypothetical protein
LEELDAPGEWFLDGKNDTLYFYPPAGMELDKATFEAVRLRHLVEFRGTAAKPVRFVTLRGLTFRHAARTFMDNREPLLRSDWTIYRGGAVFLTGTEDCALEGCFLDHVGGNAVFVNSYNRRLTIRACHIAGAGASGVAFVGDPRAVRNPLFEYGERQSLADIDLTPGPKSPDYPADCLVEDCLIYRTGRIEKQTAPVQIAMSQRITVRHCSLYDVPRAGINIGDGCWGGHLIEFCDVFDTVRETGDHGSFNSWGRDRFWGLKDIDLHTVTTGERRDLPLLDAVEPTILRHNRWRCDHGWDIDLDDGSSNYRIYSNLCLHGGLKNREGFYRVVENNVMVGNSFHPHVWYRNSEDVFRRNIVCTPYRPIRVPRPWGKQCDFNLLHTPARSEPAPAIVLQEASGRDEHSLAADAGFVDPASGDYRVGEASPALSLGFQNFPMDEFGVKAPELRAIARTPRLPSSPTAAPDPRSARREPRVIQCWQQAGVRNIEGPGDQSAHGLPEPHGVLLVDVPPGSLAALAGLRKYDTIIACGGKPVKRIEDLRRLQNAAAGDPLMLTVIRSQESRQIELGAYNYYFTESSPTGEFREVELAADRAGATIRAVSSRPGTANEPLSTLDDGRLAANYGPVFPNGVAAGIYRVDLGSVREIAAVNTWSFNQNGNRGSQRFVLYGSDSAADPGWDLSDREKFLPLIEVNTIGIPAGRFQATAVRGSSGRPLGSFRWLAWVVFPLTSRMEHAAYQEFQVEARLRS